MSQLLVALTEDQIAVILAALQLARKDDFMGGPTLGELADIDAVMAALNTQARTWQPVNPISMANDEYADAEIKLCYRRAK